MPPAEEHTLARDCVAIVIPYGSKTLLPKGTAVRVQQRLGGSLTVSADFGGLYRIDPENFDALGLEVPAKSAAAPAAERRPLEDRIWDELRSCYDPEIPVNIVELGLVYDCRVDPAAADGRHPVAIKMTLTAPGCGMGDVLAQDVRDKLEKMEEVGRGRSRDRLRPPLEPEHDERSRTTPARLLLRIGDRHATRVTCLSPFISSPISDACGAGRKSNCP